MQNEINSTRSLPQVISNSSMQAGVQKCDKKDCKRSEEN